MSGKSKSVQVGEEKAEKKPFPGFMPPMLATLTEEYFDDAEWIYERKLDGIRCLLLKQGNTTQLISRNEKDLSATFPEICNKAVSLCGTDLIADGEIVAFSGNTTSFSKLQDRLPIREHLSEAARRPKAYLYLFDLLYLDGTSLEKVSLVRRKQLLKSNLNWADPFRYTPYRRKSGQEYLNEACKKGWEGIIAKKASSAYAHSRSSQWLKFKCSHRQELVIGGFTDPEGERIGFGALLVGFYRDGELCYAGKVGTGFDDDFLKKWRRKFDAILRDTSPFANYSDDQDSRVHWVQPSYVGEFRFTEWTKAEKLRHPSFLGMRHDKEATEVTKEVPHDRS